MKTKTPFAIDMRMKQSAGIGTYLTELTNNFHKDWQEKIEYVEFDAPIYSVKEQWNYFLSLERFKLWHAPHFNIPVRKGKTKLVVTVHDLIPWIFRKDFFSPAQTFYADFMFKQISSTADHIIAVSQKTADDLMKHFKTDPKKISVIHEGIDYRFYVHSPHKTVIRKYQLPESYFLYVGGFKPHKNLPFLLKIHAELYEQGKINTPLLLVGKKDPKRPLLMREIESYIQEPSVLYREGIIDEDLPDIYNCALSLLHPSLYEGFGLTILEAMASGCAVLASSAGSIPEIAGDAALLFAPDRAAEWKEGMMQIEKNEGLRRGLQEKGLAQSRKYDWNNTSNATWNIYEKICRETIK